MYPDHDIDLVLLFGPWREHYHKTGLDHPERVCHSGAGGSCGHGCNNIYEQIRLMVPYVMSKCAKAKEVRVLVTPLSSVVLTERTSQRKKQGFFLTCLPCYQVLEVVVGCKVDGPGW